MKLRCLAIGTVLCVLAAQAVRADDAEATARLHPKRMKAFQMSRAQLFFSQLEYDKSAAIDEELLTGRLNRRERREIGARLAAAYLELGQFEKAIRTYKNLLVADPDNAEALFNLGRCYESTDMNAEARENYERCIRVDRRHWQARFGLARIFWLSGLMERAAAACSDALAINPESVELYNLQSLVEERRGRTDAAIGAQEQAAARERRADYFFRLGTLQFSARRYDQAIGRFGEAYALDPSDPQPVLLAGIACVKKGDVKAAAERFTGVIAQDRHNAPAYYYLASIALREQRIEDARRLLELSRENAQTDELLEYCRILAQRLEAFAQR